MMTELVWLVPLLPLIGFAINGLGFGRISKNMAAVLVVVLFCFRSLLRAVFFMKTSGAAARRCKKLTARGYTRAITQLIFLF